MFASEVHRHCPHCHAIEVELPEPKEPQASEGFFAIKSKVKRVVNWTASNIVYWTPRAVVAAYVGRCALGYLTYHLYIAHFQRAVADYLAGELAGGTYFWAGTTTEWMTPYINSGVIIIAGGAAACVYGLCEMVALSTLRAGASAFSYITGTGKKTEEPRHQIQHLGMPVTV